jgi:hypothetical protein
MLHGDIYGIRERVKEEYPNHDIVYVGDGRYNVIEKRKHLRYEGDHDGRSLFSIVELADVVFSFDHIPDMRVLYKLREIDLWRHPRGPIGWYDEWMEQTRKQKEKREQKRQEEFAYAAKEAHKYIINEMDGMSKTNF